MIAALLMPCPIDSEKTKLGSKLRRLNDRKENLEERLGNAGNTGLPPLQMQRGLAERRK